MICERFEVINFIIDKYNLINPNYLEIGVQWGNTISRINTNNKDGVDPDIYGCNCPFVNYKMTSDEFFEKNISKKYDIIFVDGLHTAYQVTVDIYNSIYNLNNGGWIILDDVYPHDESEQVPYYFYKKGAIPGDIWKAVYNIFDELLDMSEIFWFFPNTERGCIAFKLKSDNTKNIIIDSSIPTHVDGTKNLLAEGEWTKYSYKSDFQNYYDKIKQYTINV